MKLICYLISINLTFSLFAHNEKTFVIEDNFESNLIGESVSYYIDNDKLDITEIISKQNAFINSDFTGIFLVGKVSYPLAGPVYEQTDRYGYDNHCQNNRNKSQTAYRRRRSSGAITVTKILFIINLK